MIYRNCIELIRRLVIQNGCDVFAACRSNNDKLVAGCLRHRRRYRCDPRFSHQLQSDLLLRSVHLCVIGV